MARVIPARSNAQSGSKTSECVMLRCQVITNSRSCEKMSRSTSKSGKMAPNISDQVMMRPRFMGCEANMSSPRKTAFPINAPAMPCVMVSMVKVYRSSMGSLMLLDEEKRIFLCHHVADATRRDAVLVQRGDGGLRELW